jgi:ABC-type dipeptide/oligopeptide/nickel transport system permease component
LSPLARFAAMRGLLIPGQLLVILTVVYLFGGVLPTITVTHFGPCSLVGGACSCPSWADTGCALSTVTAGLGVFLARLFTGQWGYAALGAQVEPVTRWIAWRLGNSLELAAFALLLSALFAYPLGLKAGWQMGRPLDASVRSGSSLAILVPFMVVLLGIMTLAYPPFSRAFGDTPNGSLPGDLWYDGHGGQPAWVNIAGATSPTGFPIVDALLHGDVPFAGDVLAKTLLQAAAIAVIYAGIFLRYSRYAVAMLGHEEFLRAGRARGLSDRTLLWRHLGHRFWPAYLLVFAATLPAYLVVQSLAEVLYSTNGLGSLLFLEFGNVGATGFGFAGGAAAGNFYQVGLFLIAVVVLLGTFVAELLARYFDPTLRERRR